MRSSRLMETLEIDEESGLGPKIMLSLWKAKASFEAHALASIASLGLTLTDFAVMEILLHKGSLPINTIGKKILLTSGSITTAVDRLEARGLVKRVDDPEDRRVRFVSLTREGTRQIKAAFGEHQHHLNIAATPLSKEEQRTLIELLKKLGHGADQLMAETRQKTGLRKAAKSGGTKLGNW